MTSNSAQDPAFVGEVRNRLERDRQPDGFRRVRSRRLRNLAVIGGIPLLAGMMSMRGDLGSRAVVAGTAVVWITLLAHEYRKRPGAAAVVSEEALAAAVRGSHRCPACQAVVLPSDAGECMACGATMKPAYAVAIGAGLLLLLGIAAWMTLR